MTDQKLEDLKTYALGLDSLAHGIVEHAQGISYEGVYWNGIVTGLATLAISIDEVTDGILAAVEDGVLTPVERLAAGDAYVVIFQTYDALAYLIAQEKGIGGVNAIPLPTRIKLSQLAAGFDYLRTALVSFAEMALAYVSTSPEPEPTPDFPKLEEAGGENPFVYFAEQTRKKLQGAPLPETIDVYMPAGAYRGVSIQKDLKYADGLGKLVPWWGESMLRFVAPGLEHATLTQVGDRGWGSSLYIKPVPGWMGRVEFNGFTIQGSGANSIETGRYCPKSMADALHELRFSNLRFVDAPNPNIRTVRPYSGNMARELFDNCAWDMPHSWEHAVYTRNGLGTEMIGCDIICIGGQGIQRVNRATEYGAECFTDIPRATNRIIDCHWRRPHIDASRAGAFVTIAGDNCDTVIERSIFWDDGEGKNHNPGQGNLTYGGAAFWDGAKKGHPFEGTDDYNGLIEIRDSAFIWKRPNRGIVSFKNAEAVLCDGVSVYGVEGSRAIDVHTKALPFEWRNPYPTYHLGWIENVTPFSREELVIPPLRNPDTGETWDAREELVLSE